MKYSVQQVRQMTWQEWNETMAKELNAAGFRMRGLNPDLGRWEDDREPFKADASDPETFVLGTLRKVKEYEYLKSIGLLNNGRCPMCGSPIYSNPGRFTSGFDSSVHFQICQNCCSKGRRTSVNPANNSGCMIALLLMPWQLIKSLF